MGFDVALVGTLEFPPGKLAQWLAETVDASADEWPAGMRGGERAPAPVRALLASLAGEAGSAPVHIVADEGRLELRVLLFEDAYVDVAAPVLRAFQLAGVHGARGALDVLGFLSSDIALRVEVSSRRAKPKRLAAKDAKVARAAEGFRWIEATVEGAAIAAPRVELPAATSGPSARKKATRSPSLPISRDAAIARMLRPYRRGGERQWMVTTRHVPLTMEELLPLLDDPAVLERAPNRLELVSDRTCANRRGKSFAIGAEGARLLAESPALSRFEELSLFRAGVGDDGVAALAASPHARELRSLDLGAAGIGDGALNALARATFATLRVLRIDGNRCTAKGLTILAGGALAALERLDTDANPSPAAIAALARSAFAASLRALALSYATIDKTAAEALANSPLSSSLEHLRVFAAERFDAVAFAARPWSRLESFAFIKNTGAANLHGDDLAAIASSVPGLKRLDLDGARLARTDLETLAKSPLTATLCALRLRSLGSRDGAALFEGARWTSLETIALESDPHGDDTIAALVDAAPRLRDALFHECGLEAEAGRRLARSQLGRLRIARNPLAALVHALAESTSLRDLSLNGSVLDEGLGLVLAAGPLARSLERLHLDHTKTHLAALRAIAARVEGLRRLELESASLGPEGARVIAGSRTAPHLESLVLAGCELGPAGAGHLAAAATLGNLRRLALPLNAIGDEGARALAESAHLGRLERLDLDRGNGIGAEAATALANSQNLASLDTLTIDTNLVPKEQAIEALPHRIVCQQQIYRADREPGAADAQWQRDEAWRWRLVASRETTPG